MNQGNIRPLDGVLVLSFEHAVAAPFCTRLLADMEARVIKVERPGVGDFARGYDDRIRGMSSHFTWINRSKESLTLDLKSQEAQEVLECLLPKVDVLVQNLAPGAIGRLGLSYDQLRNRYPRLICCDISGYGIGGPYEQKKAYDLLVQSESGFLSVTGTPDEMTKAGVSIADSSTGFFAYSNILAALMLRDRIGEGSHIDMSMLETMVEMMGFPLYYAFDGAEPPARAGAHHATIYPYGPFQVADDQTVMLGLQNQREWVRFCEEVIEEPDMAYDERYASNNLRQKNREDLDIRIKGKLIAMSKDELIERLDKCGIANASVNDMHDVWEHEQLKARNRWRMVNTPVGEVAAPLPPGVNDKFDYRMDPVPDLGQHSEAILEELGFASNRISEMKSKGVI